MAISLKLGSITINAFSDPSDTLNQTVSDSMLISQFSYQPPCRPLLQCICRSVEVTASEAVFVTHLYETQSNYFYQRENISTQTFGL